jgi:hypothetical protein
MAKRYENWWRREVASARARLFLIQYCFYVTFYGTATKTLNG